MVQGHAPREFAELAATVAGVGAAVVAQPLVFFQVDGDNSRPALRIVTGGRVGNQLDALQLLGGQGLEVIAQLSAAEGHPFAIDDDQQARSAA